MKQLACALAVVSLALSGCSGSACDDLADADKDFADKTENCPSFNDGTPSEPTDAEKEQCERDLDTCSDSDKEAISKFATCVSDLPECTAATEQSTFSDAFAACALGNLLTISDACLAVSGDSVQRGASYTRSSR